MNLRFIDWIWNIRGSLPVPPEQTGDDIFDRLDPLFRENGTSHERTNDTLVFRKKGQAAQDKMSIFDGGILRIEKYLDGAVLRYHLTSRALLFCFLAPLLFLGFAQLTIFLGKFEKPPTEADSAAEKEKKKAEDEEIVKLHPLDIALGAPAPDKPKKDDKDKDKAKGGAKGKDQDKDEPDKKKKKNSPTPAYVFAGIFAALYVVGRILEDWLVKRLFRKRLLGS